MDHPLAYLVTFRCYQPLSPGAPPAYQMTGTRGDAVLEAIRRVCRREGWGLRAAGVRLDRAGAVVVTGETPAWVIQSFERYAARLLDGQADRAFQRWADSGVLYLWRAEDVAAAVHQVAGERVVAAYREQPARRLGKWADCRPT